MRVGQRRRLAQSRLPSLRMLPHDTAQDERAFLPVLRLIDENAPGVQLLRPGLAALRSRGISRYHGGEESAATALREILAEAGYAEVRVGVADGVFTAELAARGAADAKCAVIPTGQARAFLAPLPLAVLGEPELADLLRRLGISTLGGFAALEAVAVRERFGEHGARLHALARGADSRPLQPRPPIRSWRGSGVRDTAGAVRSDRLRRAADDGCRDAGPRRRVRGVHRGTHRSHRRRRCRVLAHLAAPDLLRCR
ncbi:hypothetical protein GCM10025863_04830 [Microbacterium suwonense]|uniref:Uncharacterized protein n=1 Tax=Microbacterium suwonense TaxID=683047 RepID=A0ABN6X0E6_9MICO|nr:hypothetical protein GCM10025863_04830 [Microbacterium suwonense]